MGSRGGCGARSPLICRTRSRLVCRAESQVVCRVRNPLVCRIRSPWICRARSQLVCWVRSPLICRARRQLICRTRSRLGCRARSRLLCSHCHGGAFTSQPPFSPRTLTPARSRPPAPHPGGLTGQAPRPLRAAGQDPPPPPGAGGTGQEEGNQCGEEKRVYLFSGASGSRPRCADPGAKLPKVSGLLPSLRLLRGWGRCRGAGCVRESRSVAAPGEPGPCPRAAGCDPSAALLRGTERSRREAGNGEGKSKEVGASLSPAGTPGGSRG